MATYEVDSQLLISGKIREIYENEEGVFYQLKVKYRDGSVNLSMEDKYTLPETGTYNIDDYVYIVGKVIEIFKNDDGTFYNLKIKHSTGTTNLMIEEQYIKGVKTEDEEETNQGTTGTTDPEPNPTNSEPSTDPEPGQG